MEAGIVKHRENWYTRRQRQAQRVRYTKRRGKA
jgi:hypothetical protein